MTETAKIAIVSAGSLRGKELNDVLSESPFAGADFQLMDDEAELGTLESVGDEVTFIQRIEPSSFERASFVFFAGDEALTRRHWPAAHGAGASVVDLSGALEGQPGVLVRAPWVEDELGANPGQPSPDLETPAVVTAHPVALALALLLARVTQAAPVRNASATVLEPASQYGRAAMDELHQQTVKLLNFQDLPKQVYDTQVAFNATPMFGEAAKFSLAEGETRMRRHYALLVGERLPQAGIQVVHAPVFHGYGISMAVELAHPLSLDQMEAALAGEHVDVITADGEPPTNLSVAGQPEILVRARPQGGRDPNGTKFWLWAGLDNLRIASLNAVACALELNRLRPQGKVQ
ncbi:MAG: Asd/ArgC dimerization domain-containing protein [Acidobacteriaceae bacterium]